ncbi:hypothetical protein AB0L64_17555 [Kribbella sp. NPDC051936]|uniref:hypothetical protein n=1 Tax=Kribbella sp. NPDC051936 TaxID=3154946 RepID=UPI003433A3E1
MNEEHPTLKEVRDRLEHYDDYVRGSGNAQRAGGRWRGEPLTLAMSGLNLPASRGGGPEGHVVQVSVTERAEDGTPVEVTYDVATRVIALATRTLARDMLDEAGLLDDYHVERCEMCADPSGI